MMTQYYKAQMAMNSHDWEYWEEHKVVLTQGSKIGTINYRK